MHKLTLVEGPGAPRTFVLEHRTTVIGRGPTNDIVLDGPKVSKRHVLLTIRADDELQLEDLNSRNGVYVDEQKVTEQRLASGSTLRVGDCRFRYERAETQLDSALSTPTIESGYRVVVADGSGYFDAVALKTECVYLGKGKDNDVVLPGADVSQRHAMLSYRNGAWEIYDLQSTNGTYVRGETAEQAEVEPGDRIRVGRFLLSIEGPDAPVSREELDADAAKQIPSAAAYLPWKTQIKLLAFLLAVSVLLLAMMAILLLGRR